MANSLIDDMFNESNNIGNNNFNYNNGFNSNGKKKKSKILPIIVILIFIIIIAMLGLIVYNYVNKSKNKPSVKANFMQALSSQSAETGFDGEKITGLIEKIISKDNTSKTEITISTNIEGMEDVSNYKLNLDTTYDYENHRGVIKTVVNYSDNELLNSSIYLSGDKAGFKMTELEPNYIGVDYSNMEKLMQQISSANENITITPDENINKNIELVQKVLNSKELEDLLSIEFLKTEVDKYKQAFANLPDEKFTSKSVTLQRNGEKIETVAYEVNLEKADIKSLAINVMGIAKKDNELLSKISKVLEVSGMKIDGNQLVSFIETYEKDIIASIEKAEISPVKISLYVKDSKLVKTIFKYQENLFSIDLYKKGNGNVVEYTFITKGSDEKEVGFKFTVTQTSNDATEKLKVEIEEIEENVIVTKFEINTLFKGVTDDQSLTNETTLSFNSTEEKTNLKLNLKSDIKFEKIDIEEFEGEECLLLDTLSPEEYTAYEEQLSSKMTEIMAEKMAQIELIKSNIGSSEVKPEVPEAGEEDNEQAKAEAQEKIINAVANDMYLAGEAGKEYTIKDVENVKVEGSEVSVKMEEDNAIVTIDGFTFKINSAFEISEVTENLPETAEPQN